MAGAVHPTAIIDPKAEVPSDVEVGPYSIIGPGVRLGSRCRLHAHVVIGGNATIGSDNEFFPGAVISVPPQDKKFRGEESWTTIGNNNVFREHVTVHRGTGVGGGHTRIGNGNFLMVGCHVAHDCELGNNVTMANGVLLGGHVVVGDGVGFGGVAAVHHFATIGRNAFIGGLTRVVHDVVPFMITEGHPARVRAVNKVGLKRSGLSEETIEWIKLAHRLFYFENCSRAVTRERLEQRGTPPAEVVHLLDFLDRSERGKQGRARQP